MARIARHVRRLLSLPLATLVLIVAAAHAAPAANPAPEPREPLSLDEVEIRGERLVPQAVYIVGGPETDAEAAARVSDYLQGLAPPPDRVPLCLILVPDDAAPAE